MQSAMIINALSLSEEINWRHGEALEVLILMPRAQRPGWAASVVVGLLLDLLAIMSFL